LDADEQAVILSSEAFVLGFEAVLFDNFDQSTLLFSFETFNKDQLLKLIGYFSACIFKRRPWKHCDPFLRKGPPFKLNF
jgi:hypothetical protein